MTLWFALGFVFDFMTPSSAECRKIIRAAAEQNRVVLKNVSQWRKAQWEKAAKEHVVLRNAHTPLPGCRGYRVCWQSSTQNGGECPHGDLLLIFVPSTRKFHREEDFRKGFDCGPPMSAREKEEDQEESENEDEDDEDEEEEEEEGKQKKKTTAKAKKRKTVVKSAKEVLDALDRISKVNEQLWYVRERILKNGESIDVEALAESTKKSLGENGDDSDAPSSSSASSSLSSSSKQKEDGDEEDDNKTEDAGSNEDEDDDDDSNVSTMDKYGSPEQAWENGQGADAVSLWLRYNINFDFHGPAGFVNRSVVKAAAEEKGIQTSQCESWPKHTWIDVAERAGVTFKSSHAAISQCGRGWKLCWVDDDVNITMKGKRASSSTESAAGDDAEDSDSSSDERRRRRRGSDGTSASHDDGANGGVPQAFVWVPETAKYYTFGAALKNKRSKIAGVSVQDVAKAAVAAAKSQPPPPGLKAALLRDSDFLATLGRAASKETAEKKKEASPPMEDEDASEETREEKLLAMAREAGERMEDDEDDDYENQRETVYPPGFEGPDGEGGDTIDGTHISSEFYSRSAGYLSFVENDWTEEDAMRQMGLKNVPDYYSDEVLSSQDEEQEDFIEATTSEGDEEEQKLPKPVTLFDFEQRDEQVAPLESPKTFPDRMAELKEQQEQQSVAIATRKSEHVDLWQKFPEDLPDSKQWELHRLAGVDYLVLKLEDGRLDFNEVMKVKRDEYTGRCTSKLERVDTSGQVGKTLQPMHYAPIHWTEQHHELKEGWDESNPDPRALSTYTREWERTTKVYLVPKSGDDVNATLDFTKPLILFTNGESSEDIFQVHDAISGARENPDGVLVVKKGELTVVPQTSVPGYEELIQNWEQEVDWSEEKKNFNEDFYREIDFDQDIGDETPEIDLI
jgi:hypothetical protein